MLELKPLALLAQLVNFAVLMWVLHLFLFRPIREVLEKRRRTIEESFREIATQNEAARQNRREYEARLERIEAELTEMKREAIRDAQRQKEEIIEEARQEAKSIVEKSRVSIENETLLVLASLRDHLVQLSIRSAERILDEKLDETKHLAVIERVLAETEKLQWPGK